MSRLELDPHEIGLLDTAQTPQTPEVGNCWDQAIGRRVVDFQAALEFKLVKINFGNPCIVVFVAQA